MHRLSSQTDRHRRFAQCNSHSAWEQLLSSPVSSVLAPQIQGQVNHAQVSKNTKVSHIHFHTNCGQFTRSSVMQGSWYGSQGLQGRARQHQLKFWQRGRVMSSTRGTIILRTTIMGTWFAWSNTSLVFRGNWPGKARRKESSLLRKCGKRESWSPPGSITTGHSVKTSIGREQGLEVLGDITDILSKSFWSSWFTRRLDSSRRWLD